VEEWEVWANNHLSVALPHNNNNLVASKQLQPSHRSVVLHLNNNNSVVSNLLLHSSKTNNLEASNLLLHHNLQVATVLSAV
jgi:hypothetical protein